MAKTPKAGAGIGVPAIKNDGVGYIKRVLDYWATNRPELWKIWERDVGTKIRGLFDDPRRRSKGKRAKGPYWETICQAATSAGMDVIDFLAPGREMKVPSAPETNTNDMAWCASTAYTLLARKNVKPTANLIGSITELLYETLPNHPASSAEREAVREHYAEVIPLLLRRRRLLQGGRSGGGQKAG